MLLARSILSATEESLINLLREVAEGLEVPVVGVLSDGQHSIRRAVARVFPKAPHQLCQFHYLRVAAKEVYEADRYAKKELKKRVRGVRPIERELEGRQDPEKRRPCVATAWRYAARSPTMDGPALGLRHKASRAHRGHPHFHRARRDKKGIPAELVRLRRMLSRALTQTEPLWPPIHFTYSRVHRAAHIFSNEGGLRVERLRRDYRHLLAQMSSTREQAGDLSGAVSVFLKVTKSYRKGLFHCYRFLREPCRVPTTTSSTSSAAPATMSGGRAAGREHRPRWW